MKKLKTRQQVPEEPGPVRTCLGCGKKQLKSLLHRLVLNAQHQPLLDRAQNAPGRGAYLCGPGCLSAATKKKAFQRAFKKAFQQAMNHPLDLTNLEADLQPKR